MMATVNQPMPQRVLFYVQHLLGIGHMKRASLICNALAARGFKVTLVSGGFPLPQIELCDVQLAQLPPARTADTSFSHLLDETGQPIDEAWKARRRDLLLRVYEETCPGTIILEMYPFGRRQMRFELIPLLEAARSAQPRPLILCSLRDILAKAPIPERAEWIIGQINRFFDRVLVHADPKFVILEDSFPEASQIADKLVYTGFVAESTPVVLAHEAQARHGVVVSAGGGAVAEALIDAALAARPLSSLRDEPWQLLVGPNYPATRLAALQASAAKGVSLARAHSNFPELLSKASLSISQGGYNTVTDVLRAGPRSIIVPFAAEGEAEQTLRANLLAQTGAVVVVEEKTLTAATLAAAIDRAMAQEKDSQSPGLDLGGAVRTATWLQAHLAERAAT